MTSRKKEPDQAATTAAERKTQPWDRWEKLPGDVVQLKSGGPAMTVCQVFDDGDVHCDWFDIGGNRNAHRFPAASLNTIDEPSD